MFGRRILFLFLALCLAVSLAGCGSADKRTESTKAKSTSENVSAFPMTVTDSYNRQVKIEKEPKKIISVAPNITEIVFALGKSSELIGRSEYCDYPEEAKKVPSVGSLEDPSIEKIVALKPDLVIASTHFKKEIVEKLERLGVKVVVFYGEQSFEGAYTTIEKVGMVLNAKDNAQKIVSEMKTKVQNVLDKVKDKPCPGVYYVVSFGKTGDYTAGSDTFIGQMIKMAGGRNVADDVKGWAYSLEKLAEKKPDIVICTKYYNSKKGIEAANGYKELSAVKNGKLFEIDSNLLDRQGVRLADGLTELARIIHPEAFK